MESLLPLLNCEPSPETVRNSASQKRRFENWATSRQSSRIAVLGLLFLLSPWLRADPSPGLDPKHRGLLETYCQGCHGPEKQKGKFRVDDLLGPISTVERAEKWQKILNTLNAGEMPPEDEKQPDPKAKADFLEDLAHVMVAARKGLSDQHGRTVLRRLNRREYRNTLRELLGVELEVNELPADTRLGAFDTIGSNLFMSSDQFEQYEALGREALEEAFALHAAAPLSKKLRVEAESTLDSFTQKNQEAHKELSKATAWIKAVNDAIASPANAPKVAELKKTLLTDENLRHAWEQIPGAPAPEQYGFAKNVDVQVIHELAVLTQFVPYEYRYLQMPGLKSGAYLTLPSAGRSQHNNNHLPLPLPADWPVGPATVRIRVGALPQTPPERRFIEFGVAHNPYSPSGKSPFFSIHHVVGTVDQPQTLEIPYKVSRKRLQGRQRELFVRERGAGDLSKSVQAFRNAFQQNGIGPDLALWVDWIEIERQPVSDADMPPGIRALHGVPLDDKVGPVTPEVLRPALERFSLEAFRGTAAPAEDLERLLTMYQVRIGRGVRHSEALKAALVSVLSSPRFLYRAEPGSDERRRVLTGPELATRLSYLLWGAPPDAPLRAAASSGKILNPGELAAHTDRLLQDPRSDDFVSAFVSQWLLLDRLDFFQFNPKLFPKFDDGLKAATRAEVTQTFAHLLATEAPLSDLLKADYVVVNGLLAHYYGIEGVEGDSFCKVPLPADSPRGGLLGMAAILAMGGNGERTNPVERGAWVLRKLLNDPPPPAPANVPEITRLAGKLLTTRERLQAHQEDPQCASCHRKIDPLGFGLENFDAAGQWRTHDTYQALGPNGKPDPKATKTWAIEAGATLHKGPSFKDYYELRDILRTRTDAFATGFAAALIEYALGRPCGFSDEPLIARMLELARPKGFTPRAFLHALIQSPEFHSK
jgi:hypothetical protein